VNSQRHQVANRDYDNNEYQHRRAPILPTRKPPVAPCRRTVRACYPARVDHRRRRPGPRITPSADSLAQSKPSRMSMRRILSW
jgi:hypothetical protein